MRTKHPLSIDVKDEIKVTERLATTKRWFNGAKHFFSVKVLPPQKKKGD